MLSVDWTASDGWSAPRIQPHENLQLSPAAMTLHYALQCFEGMKAYRGDDDAIRLFRPDLNAKRMTSSLRRLAMPTFDEDRSSWRCSSASWTWSKSGFQGVKVIPCT